MSKVTKAPKTKVTRYYLEGTWSGYTSAQRKVCHRTVISANQAEKYSKITSILFTDGTSLDLVLCPLKKGERATDIKNSYTTLINDCIYYGVDSVEELNIAKEKAKAKFKFYFTFGSDPENQIHVGGWVVIEAKDYFKAREKFVERYGLNKDNSAPFAFQYTEEEFKNTIMYKQGSNFGHGEWVE